MKELKELKEAFASDLKKLETAKASPESDHKTEMEYMYSSIRSMGNYIYALENKLWESKAEMMDMHRKHADGSHIPPIKDASMMEKVLAKLGLQDSYSVVKPAIYCSASINNKTIEIQARKKETK